MVDLTIFKDPSVLAIELNLISTILSNGLSKNIKQIFRQPDIIDYLNHLPVKDKLDQDLNFDDLSEKDLGILDFFVKEKDVVEIVSQLYMDSDKSYNEVEDEFTQLFCKVKPLNERSNERVARNYFYCVILAVDDTLYSEIKSSKLIALEYKDQKRYNELEKVFKLVLWLFMIRESKILM